jgi:hypothetical protein
MKIKICEHPTKTRACATHEQFTMQAVAVAMGNGEDHVGMGSREER